MSFKVYSGRLLIWIALLSLVPQGIPLSIGDRTPVLLYFDVVILFLLFAYLPLVFFRFVNSLRENKTILILSVFYVVAQILSLMTNQSDIFRSILAIKVFTFGTLIFFIIPTLCKLERDIDWIIYGLVSFCTITSLLLIYNYATDWSLESSLNKDIIGIGMGYSNYLASFLAFVIPISFGLLLSERQIRIRLLFAICTIIMLLALVITMSRGAFFSLVIGLFVVFPIMFRAGSRIKYLLTLVVICGGLYFLTPGMLKSFYIEQIDYRIHVLDTARIDMLRIALNVFLENPVFGVGPNSINIYNLTASGFTYDTWTHNFVLKELSEVGLLGGVPFMLIIIFLLIRSYKLCFYCRRDPRWKYLSVSIFTGIVVTLTHGLMELTFSGGQYSVVFWVIMSVVFLKYKTYNIVPSTTSSQAIFLTEQTT